MRERKVGTSGTKVVGLGIGRMCEAEEAFRMRCEQLWHIRGENEACVGGRKGARREVGVLGGMMVKLATMRG